MATPITVTVTPGYLLGDNEELTPAICRAIAQPTVAITSGLNIPNSTVNFLRNSNFNKSDFLAPIGVSGITAASGVAPALTVTNPRYWSAVATPLNTSAGNSKNVTITCQTDGATTTSVYAAEIDVDSASFASLGFYQNMASDIAGALKGSTMTFSIYIKNTQSASFTPSLSLWAPTSADAWSTAAQVSTNLLQVCPQSVWTQMTATFNIPTSASNGLRFQIDIPNAALTALAGSTCGFRFGESQLVQGDTTLPYQSDPSLVLDIINPGNILAASSSWFHPDAPPLVATQWDDEFDGPNLNTDIWTVSSGGTAGNYSLGGSYLNANIAATAASFILFNQNISSFSGSPFEFTAKMTVGGFANALLFQGNFGICNTGNTKSLCAGLYVNSTNGINFTVSKGDPTASGGTSNSIGSNNGPFYGMQYFRVGYNGTHLYVAFSADGINFVQVYSESYTSGPSFGGDPIQGVFLSVFCGNGSFVNTSWDWIRRTV
jgi:hypothetical protein